MKRHSKEKVSIQRLSPQLFEVCQQVRELVEDDHIAEALERLREIAESEGPPLSIDLIDLKRRFHIIKRDETAGVMTREDAEVEKNKIIRHLLTLTDQIDYRPRGHAPVRELS